LTGQRIISADRDTAAAAGAIPEVAAALYDSTLDDVPNVPARPLDELVMYASQALALSDDVQLHLAGRGLGSLITELHVHGVTGDTDTRRAALAALIEALTVARSLAGTVGHAELAVTATRRGYDAARALERPDLVGLMAMGRTMTLGRIGARHRALKVAEKVLGELPTGPVGEDTTTAQARGMLHLSAALVSARAGSTEATTHLDEARDLAKAVGERNHMRYHFGPANVGAWELTIAVESCNGPEVAERHTTIPINLAAFRSRDREASFQFDLARAWAQAGGDRDDQVIRALDTADRLAPIRVRTDPIARDLVFDVDRRAKRRLWELTSLKNRLGVA
jgi:hypothetical protein